MQRQTWDGIALQAGRITGSPASHSCIRLRKEDQVSHGRGRLIARLSLDIIEVLRGFAHGPSAVCCRRLSPMKSHFRRNR